MPHEFDKDYWERHWQARGTAAVAPNALDAPNALTALDGSAPLPGPHPYLARETAGLVPGTALEAGCGTGAEAIWLAAHGWQVTAADIAAEALARAAERVAGSEESERVRWVEADLTVWQPSLEFDLVTTHYAHPAIPQLAFYERISRWVAPGGTLLIVGHLHLHGDAAERNEPMAPGESAAPGKPAAVGEQGEHPPAEASVTLADITAVLDGTVLDGTRWEIATAEEHHRTVIGPGNRAVPLHDVVVRATRRLPA